MVPSFCISHSIMVGVADLIEAQMFPMSKNTMLLQRKVSQSVSESLIFDNLLDKVLIELHAVLDRDDALAPDYFFLISYL